MPVRGVSDACLPGAAGSERTASPAAESAGGGGGGGARGCQSASSTSTSHCQLPAHLTDCSPTQPRAVLQPGHAARPRTQTHRASPALPFNQQSRVCALTCIRRWKCTSTPVAKRWASGRAPGGVCRRRSAVGGCRVRLASHGSRQGLPGEARVTAAARCVTRRSRLPPSPPANPAAHPRAQGLPPGPPVCQVLGCLQRGRQGPEPVLPGGEGGQAVS